MRRARRFGAAFRLEAAQRIPWRHALPLSGGIGVDDADTLKSLNLPMMAGVDINSRFETEPGVKDINKVKTFINKLR